MNLIENNIIFQGLKFYETESKIGNIYGYNKLGKVLHATTPVKKYS